jgi:hypothetical protein
MAHVTDCNSVYTGSIPVDHSKHGRRRWVGQLNGKNYFVGDISALAFVNKHLNMSAGVFGDRLENLESLENDITFYGAYVNADVYNDYGGFNFLAKQARFDGTVRRDTLAVKGHVNLIDGFHAYVNHSNMTNTENSVFFLVT